MEVSIEILLDRRLESEIAQRELGDLGRELKPGVYLQHLDSHSPSVPAGDDALKVMCSRIGPSDSPWSQRPLILGQIVSGEGGI